MEVFDKVVWHVDNGMDIEEAKKHLNAVMFFLYSNNLLSKEGVEIFNEDGVDLEFSLNSELLNIEGHKFIKKYYKSYLKDVAKSGVSEAIKKLHQKFQLYQIKVPRNKGFLYDSIDAHLIDNKKEYYDINYYFKYLLRWLFSKKLLTEEAQKYLDIEFLPEQFELRSWMLNDIANAKLPRIYDKWLKQIKLGQKDINMDILENAISEKK